MASPHIDSALIPDATHPAPRRRLSQTAAILLLVTLCIGLPIVGAGCGSSSSSSVTSSGASGGAAPPPSGPGVSPSQAQQAIQTFQDQLRSANIAFNTPTKLELGGSGVVDLQLSMQTALNALRARLGTAGATVVARIQASNVMTASLTSGEFKIQDLSAQTQAVGSPITEWKWEIEPTQPGVLPLYLSMTAVVTVNGRPTNYGVRTFNRTLLVRSVPVAWYTKVTRYLSGNWAWIAGLLGALAAALRALTRRREAMPGDADRARTPSPNGRQHVGDGSPRLPTRVPGNPDRHRSHGTRRR